MVTHERERVGAVGLQEETLLNVHETSERSCVDGTVE